MKTQESPQGINRPLLSNDDLVHLAWARYLANDNLISLCNTDWRANNLNQEQQGAVLRWLKLTELVRVP